MPKNQVTDLITDQEMAFARLVLAGTMTDQQAAVSAGLKSDTAAYTKSKPRVRAYMLEHRAAIQQQLVQQQAEEMRRETLRREQVRQRVLDRLWELAGMSSEATRGSITNQIKAISMIVAIENLIPDRRAGKNAAPPPPNPYLETPTPLDEQPEETAANPATTEEEDPSEPSLVLDSEESNTTFAPDTRIPFANRHPFFPRR